jgi:uncharacterized YceG family protein
MSTGRPPGRRPRPARATNAGRGVLIGAVLGVLVLVAIIAGVVMTSGGSDAPVATTPTTIDVLFVEGKRRTEYAAVLQEKTGIPAANYIAATDPSKVGQTLAGTKRLTSLEGFLFPATYPVNPKTPVSELVNYQLRTYQEQTATVNYAYAKAKNLTRYDVLILASIIEREASTPRDRRLIAGVFYNRLRLGMRLDSDVTVHYALGSWSKELTKADLNLDSPYNTRKFHGLPPTPICNPGLDSIKAAARPTPSKFLYFVASPSGKVFYATSDAEFQQAIAQAKANG